MATVKTDPRLYKWYEYKGRTVELRVNDVIVTLSKNDVFALKKGKYWIYTDPESLEYKIKLDQMDADRLINNSKGWEGKVGRYKVESGVGGLDNVNKVKPAIPTSPTSKPIDVVVEIKADSSNLHRIAYNPKKKILYIEFRSGDRWAYYDVSKSEADGIATAKSQGSYFHFMIKTQKDQKKVKEFK